MRDGAAEATISMPEGCSLPHEVIVMDENYTINDNFRACGLPGDDEDDLDAGAIAIFSSSAASIQGRS